MIYKLYYFMFFLHHKGIEIRSPLATNKYAAIKLKILPSQFIFYFFCSMLLAIAATTPIVCMFL